MAEKRASERRRALRTGKIVWNNGGSVIDCTVRNISKTGALLGVLSVATVPQEFDLRWDGNARPCIVVWRKPDRIGVKFIP
jgi:PilZ domain